MPSANRQIVLAAVPNGMPKETDFRLIESPMPHPGAGEALVRSLYLSVDPYMRGRMTGKTTYARGVQPGEVMVGGVVGEVVESNDPRFASGDIVEGMLGWQDYAVAPAKSLRKIDPSLAPITTALYVLGMPGLTAYFGLLEICRPQPGETVVVSGAAGAVGSLVGQIAKIKRCRAIGIAGSDEKIRFITQELGFDGGFNYRETRDYGAKLKELCPNGIDIYFDNVGGPITDEVIKHINTRARIAVCGQISQYNADQPEMGPRWMGQLIAKQAKVEGFLVMQFADRYEEGLKQLATWLREKKIKYREDVAEGLENAPAAFIGMMQGKNIGKQLVQVWKEGAALTGAARG
ncbi:MAG TPA: NADP-dependent oxidoreductase [Bryobacteraceae bacterium]|jgi:NADPH-dependent curcumin reductase CurA|nr:NADP-dependent oxidoreductase [Bryobacteraceae bacterium]